MIIYVENPTESTKQLLEPVSLFSKVARYKFNIENTQYFYTLAKNWKLKCRKHYLQ